MGPLDFTTLDQLDNDLAVPACSTGSDLEPLD